MTTLPLLYRELAGWFHLLSPPEEYVEEAAVFRDLMTAALPSGARRLLELGAGAGSNALHLKKDFDCTLTDLSPEMLQLSESLNPECEHVVGDMRTLRLGRQFDAVFVHDAVVYMTTEGNLKRAIETAFVHCRPGGVALFATDWARESFRPSTSHGGSDGEGRALRYLEWDWDPDPDDTTYLVDFVYVLREQGQDVRVVHDRHEEGLFSRATWLRLLEDAGFRARCVPRPATGDDIGEVFVAEKPA